MYIDTVIEKRRSLDLRTQKTDTIGCKCPHKVTFVSKAVLLGVFNYYVLTWRVGWSIKMKQYGSRVEEERSMRTFAYNFFLTEREFDDVFS